MHNELRVPQEVIDILKKPFGDLIGPDDTENGRIIDICRVSRRLITVGDTTTGTVVRSGLVPDLSIIDGLERRQASTTCTNGIRSTIASLSGCDVTVLSCRNEPGSISSEALSTLSHALSCRPPVLVRVIGEEDLIALPLIAFAPAGSTVLYGQPSQGIVVVRINKRIREKAKHLMRRIGFDFKGYDEVVAE